MAFSCGFYNAINHDRVYSSTQFGEMFDGLINDGIYATIGNAFAVIPNSGTSVIVRSGRAWFNKTWSVNTTDYPIELDMPDLLLPRIDAIILEVDTRVSTRNNSLKKVTGQTSATPIKPTLTRSDGLYQYPLAYITVKANATTITKTDIENTIGRSPTPFVTGILQSISIDDAWNQWEGQFEDWFATVKNALSGDIASNLLNQIVALQDSKLNIGDKATIIQAQTGTNDTKWMTPSLTTSHFIYRKASDSEISNGSNVNKWVSPAQLVNAVNKRIPSSMVSVTLTNKSLTSWTLPSDAISRFINVELMGGGGGGGGGGSGGVGYGTGSSDGTVGGPGTNGGTTSFGTISASGGSYGTGGAGGEGEGGSYSSGSHDGFKGSSPQNDPYLKVRIVDDNVPSFVALATNGTGGSGGIGSGTGNYGYGSGANGGSGGHGGEHVIVPVFFMSSSTINISIGSGGNGGKGGGVKSSDGTSNNSYGTGGSGGDGGRGVTGTTSGNYGGSGQKGGDGFIKITYYIS